MTANTIRSYDRKTYLPTTNYSLTKRLILKVTPPRPVIPMTIIFNTVVEKVKGWILHQSTLLSNIIGSGSTLERNFWFGRLGQKSEGRYFHQRFTRWIICQYWEVSMQLVSLKMRGSVAVNGIFGLKWRHDGLKGDILEYWGTLVSWFITLLYPIKR